MYELKPVQRRKTVSEQKQQKQTDQNGLFEDLIKEAPISSLNISEPGLESFNAAKTATGLSTPQEKKSRFGKRAARNKETAAAPDKAPAFAEVGSLQEPVTSQETESETSRIHKSDAILEPPVSGDDLRDKASASSALIQDLQSEKPEESLTEEEERLFSSFVEVPATARKSPRREEPAPVEEEEEAEEEDDVVDPGASLEDDTDYDLYEDRKSFMLSDYRKQDEYLAKQAKQGYHFVKREGRKYYFHKKTPGSYYYRTLYFSSEPSKEQWEAWAKDGWELVSRAPAKKKREAGWVVMRQREVFDELHKDIDNELEKYKFFKAYSSSCRSTMFMLFICMAVCAVTAFLQWQFKGYPAAIILSGILFAISFIVFLMYGRMLRKSKKEARLLKARWRNKERDAELFDLNHLESQDDLDEEWEKMNPRYKKKH